MDVRRDAELPNPPQSGTMQRSVCRRWHDLPDGAHACLLRTHAAAGRDRLTAFRPTSDDLRRVPHSRLDFTPNVQRAELLRLGLWL